MLAPETGPRDICCPHWWSGLLLSTQTDHSVGPPHHKQCDQHTRTRPARQRRATEDPLQDNSRNNTSTAVINVHSTKSSVYSNLHLSTCCRLLPVLTCTLLLDSTCGGAPFHQHACSWSAGCLHEYAHQHTAHLHAIRTLHLMLTWTGRCTGTGSLYASPSFALNHFLNSIMRACMAATLSSTRSTM